MAELPNERYDPFLHCAAARGLFFENMLMMLTHLVGGMVKPFLHDTVANMLEIGDIFCREQ
jgi:hypothetical protein